jgi:hypothetical protein
MHRLFFVVFLVLAVRASSQPCANATLLLPLVTPQIKQGMSLIVFQGSAAPQVPALSEILQLRQDLNFNLLLCFFLETVYLSRVTRLQYACVVAGWSSLIQSLEVSVKAVESVEEVMRLAAPCTSEPSLHPCAAGLNTSAVLVFSEIALLDLMVTRVSEGAVRALPYGLFAVLVPKFTFNVNVGGSRGDAADESEVSEISSAYHNYMQMIFTSLDIQLPKLSWPSTISTSEEHAAWLTQAAVDAWLKVVPFPYLMQAQAVVNSRSSIMFVPNASDAIGANGAHCTLASIHLDRASYYLRNQNYDMFVFGAWHFIDLSSVCLFSALNLRLKHPARNLIEKNFNYIYWKLHQLDRSPLPPMPGCEG